VKEGDKSEGAPCLAAEEPEGAAYVVHGETPLRDLRSISRDVLEVRVDAGNGGGPRVFRVGDELRRRSRGRT
jgi:hypothetical protein